MNEIIKHPINALGYSFISDKYLPKGKDEYYLRNIQNRNGIEYRNLSAYEIEVLVRNRNTSDDWAKIYVSDAFNPELVKNCKFYGLVRIGKLEPVFLRFNNVSMPVGLYSSTIISCDFGDNVVVNNVTYLSHYIIGNEVMLSNIHELHTTSHSKFGNGIIKEGEDESVRIWLELCNENGGRKIMPFNGMLPGDAFLWAKYRDDKALLDKFTLFTEKRFTRQRGYYGKIGDRTVIKNCSIIKDVWVGSDAYIKGANKLKNLTINSSPQGKTQIGEGCELVNGIIGFGCRIFYGVKAVRFITASNAQLKYGARLINSYLGNNATISCCEVLNSLIYPAHEQHHNNSFLCAALIMGQSNMAAGATIGSNHNSRAADGEIVAGRGFWPGLCVSLKHNSKFASFTIIAKGDYSAELNIPIPFSLISNDVSNNQLLVMPAYWFLYNMYALARNSKKYVERDKRIKKTQNIEYDFLAPDSVNEMFTALDLLRKFSALAKDEGNARSEEELIVAGEKILSERTLGKTRVLAKGFENEKRPVVLLKAQEAYDAYKEMIIFYGISQLIEYVIKNPENSPGDVWSSLPATAKRNNWYNLGGQLMPEENVTGLLDNIKSGVIKSWTEIHDFYRQQGQWYPKQKMQHAQVSLLEVLNLDSEQITSEKLRELLQQAVIIKEKMVENIYQSRAKDYQNEFKSMVYDTKEEMEEVIGSLEENAFIRQQKEELCLFKKDVAQVLQKLN